ncbi:Two component system sensor histidine kinase, PAS domain-containing [Desulfonema limicola]|uniref:histidine kinase n=1 Tax=Desulfonema limicola TaxID=45656 RepID=A0A975GG06_9BACT|nr:PAS domain-containing sensor histidine kinase [Desulfonema limicola]QTA79740.1 Two component system sensor histidine kinase, PAS domain-containing [Desulfonema limicola]
MKPEKRPNLIQERYKDLIENQTDLVASFKPDGTFLFVNKGYCSFFEKQKHDFIGKKWQPIPVDDDLEHIQAKLMQMSPLNPEVIIENRVFSGKGRIHWMQFINKGLFDKNGSLLEIQSVGRDITDRKLAEKALQESEEKLNTLFDAMTELVVLHEMLEDENGEFVNYRITACNQAFAAVTGIKQHKALGKTATEVYQTETAPYLKEYSLVVKTGKPFEFTTYYPAMDKYFMISAVSLKENRFATITTDITAIKQVQEVISAKNKELENYLYVASHDLRSPLVNIQGFSQRLQKQVNSIKNILSEYSFEKEIQQKIEKITDEGIPKSLEFIFTNVSKMDSLINGLLQISRTGRVQMNIKKIEMNMLIKKIIESLSFQIENIADKFIVQDLPACYGDENLLNQLFSNLIGNALKYKDQNRPLIITVSAETRYNRVIYSIQDTGIGIAKRHLEKIWDVFYRVDARSEEAGEGIGLSIVKRIADKHQGKVFAESREGRGSIFYVELMKEEFSEASNNWRLVNGGV